MGPARRSDTPPLVRACQRSASQPVVLASVLSLLPPFTEELPEVLGLPLVPCFPRETGTSHGTPPFLPTARCLLSDFREPGTKAGGVCPASPRTVSTFRCEPVGRALSL